MNFSGFDYEAICLEQRKIDALKKAGKACPSCQFYKKYDNPAKGCCRGYCKLKTEKFPERPRMWGVSLKDVCTDYLEDKDALHRRAD